MFGSISNGRIFELSVDLFTTDASNAVYLVWGYMRDFANIALAIVLLVVILSQLTGIGIDNYGIKKTIPRLIVAALLINLSFIICQVAIDLSNITGYGLDHWLIGIRDDVKATLIANGANKNIFEIGISWLVGGLFGVGALAAGTAGIAASVFAVVGATWWILLIVLIILAFIVLMAVVIFYLLLAARVLLVAALVIAAPLAFVCLIFPNTNNIFKKWLKLMEAMLLLYPICGLLHGLSKIIWVIAVRAAGTHIWMITVATFFEVAPLAIAPLLLKKSMGAIGSLAGRISGGARSGITRGVGMLGATEAIKDAGRQFQMKNTEKKFNKVQKKLEAGKGRYKQGSWRRGGIERAQGRRMSFLENAKKQNAMNAAIGGMSLGGMMSQEDMQEEYSNELYDKNLSAGLLSWEKNGITFADGTKAVYNVDNLERKLAELSKIDDASMTDGARREIAMASRGLLSLAGGGGKFAEFIRGNKDKGGTVAFQKALQDSYNNDSKVRNALSQKDTRANYFMEQRGLSSGRSYSDFMSNAENKQTADARVTTDEQGFNQSGEAFTEYLKRRVTDEASAREVLTSIGATGHLSGLKVKDKDTIRAYAAPFIKLDETPPVAQPTAPSTDLDVPHSTSPQSQSTKPIILTPDNLTPEDIQEIANSDFKRRVDSKQASDDNIRKILGQ